jgi:cytochrome c-type biogenesis protein CcmH/NrfG
MASDFRLLRNIIVPLILVSLILLLSFGISYAATSEETAKSYFEEGTELNKQQRYDEAIEMLTKAVRLSLETHKYHQALFMTYLATRNGLKAMEIYKGLVREFPKSPVVRYWLGRLYLQSQSFDDAAREFREATRLAPKDEHGWISLGHVYYRQGKDDAAMKAYLEADRLSPKVAVVHSGLGNLYLKKSDYAKARKELSEALRIDPSLTEARYNLSLIYEKNGEISKAIQEWQRILEDDPNESEARERLARAYFQKKQYADAVREYSTLSQVRQGSPDVFLALGESQILLASSLTDPDDRAHLMESAEESFRRVLELDPANEEAKSYLARLLTPK